jgi:Dolichyl-phosphate-mannose-protein mannosyltransferase
MKTSEGAVESIGGVRPVIESATPWKERISPWVFVIAAIYFALQMVTATHYGYFRDALYYLACAEHVDWGYVDQPPLIAWIGWLVWHTIGTSLPALMLVPALAGAARVILTAAFARALGAKRFGMALAAMLGATPAVWYVTDHQFAMNTFEALLWTGCAYVVLRMIQTENPKYWLWFGAISGLGLQNKYSIAAFAFALLAGLLLTPWRKLFFTPWLFAGGAVALLIFLPNLIWNMQHHWPFLELMRNIRASGRDVILSPGAFIGQQILIMTPGSLPFWLAGLGYLLLAKDARAYRALGWAFVVTIAFFLLAHGKNYYSAPVYPIVLAAGAAAVERWMERQNFAALEWPRRTFEVCCFVWLAVSIGLLLPLVLPVLPVDTYLRYQEHLPFAVPRSEHGHMGTALPQHYGDEFGWEEMVAATARVYHSLTPEEQAKTAIFANNYGEAGAIDLFGPKYGLPKAISGHQSYFLWGPRNYTGEIVIVLGSSNADNDRAVFESVEVAAKLNNPYAMRFENRAILLCRGLKWNLQTEWARVKHWD